ncbi:MAG: hypothetical protein RL637_433 [Pseudomonadota bacterium]|jgi:predicted DCC family thiol-disulfide oxidoreductase YuxK
MYSFLRSLILQQLRTPAPATGLGLFRLLFGLVTFQEIVFLLYFNHLIFDPIPYLDVEFPMIHFFLCLWAIVAFCLTIGYHCQMAIISNYLFWLIFVNFTPMQRDFDGGFDLFMIGVNFFLLFLPIDKAWSIDQLRYKLASPFKAYHNYSVKSIPLLAYSLPVTICLGFLYFDSAIHKLFAPHWRNGLGGWLPATMPYYISALNLSWWLNQEILQKIIGYIILIFQFSFIFLVHQAKLRPIYALIGISLHLSIILTLNIYPFGFGMLICYSLVIPFSWYQQLANWFTAKTAYLTVYYDQQCPLCNRTVLTLNHFDIFRRIAFKPAQSEAKLSPVLQDFNLETLLTDLYAVDQQQRVYSGVNTYAEILIAMRYPAILGYFLKLPMVFNYANAYYRSIADNRLRLTCQNNCEITPIKIQPMWADHLWSQSEHFLKNVRILTKIIMLLIFLQLNSSIHYGLLYRFKIDLHTPLIAPIAAISNSLLIISNSFVGITPHALYVHDHFQGYNHLLAITYLDNQGHEQWLPFIDSTGRMLTPNWGRVHSMWANIAVTPKIDPIRLHKGIMRITAFWGTHLGLDLNHTQFLVKYKPIHLSNEWTYDLLNNNLSGQWQTIGQAHWHQKTIDIQWTKPSYLTLE